MSKAQLKSRSLIFFLANSSNLASFERRLVVVYRVRRGLSTLKGGNSRVYPYPSKGKGRVGFYIFPKGIEG